jgi:hypothetical protein
MLFDGVMQSKNGCIYPDVTRTGMGLEFKYGNAEKYKIY